jgi:hypothetical protein
MDICQYRDLVAIWYIFPRFCICIVKINLATLIGNHSLIFKSFLWGALKRNLTIQNLALIYCQFEQGGFAEF